NQLSGARHNLDVAVLYLPLRLLHGAAASLLGPMREILAVEQNDRIRGRRFAHIWSGRDFCGAGPLDVVDLPLLVRQLRRVVITADVVAGLGWRLVASPLLLGRRRRGLRGKGKRKQCDRREFHSWISQK